MVLGSLGYGDLEESNNNRSSQEEEYTCSDENSVRAEIQMGDYRRHGNTQEESKYIRVLSDYQVEIIYHNPSTDDVRVESYNVSSCEVVTLGQ